MISIKVTGLVDMKLLKKMNDSILLRDEFWKKNNVDNIMSAQQAFNGLQKLYSGVSD